MKSKLMSAIAMLTLSAVMLTSVSFAWFTISTAPEITMMTTSVSTNDNLEIVLAELLDDATTPAAITADATAVTGAQVPTDASDTGALGDSGQNEKWGNQIDLTGAFDGIELKPVILATETVVENDDNTYAFGTDSTLYAPVYGSDGRVSTYSQLSAVSAIVDGVTDDDAAADATTDGFITEFVYTNDATTTADTTDDSIVSYAFAVSYYLRTNTEGAAVGLQTDAVDRGMGEGTDEVGLGSYIDLTNVPEELWEDIRIDFVVDTTDALGTSGEQTQYTAVLSGTTETGLNNVTTTTYNYVGDDSSTTKKVELVLYGYENGKLVETETTLFTADEDLVNQAVLVTMYVYLDGESISNADITNTDDDDANVQIEDLGLNIQFSSTTVTDVMDPDATTAAEEAAAKAAATD